MAQLLIEHLGTRAVHLLWQWCYLLPILSLAGYVVYERFFSPLAKIPGPFWASFSRIWLGYITWTGRASDVTRELHKKYGNVVRIASDEVSLADPQAIKPVYGFGTRCDKSTWYGPINGTRKFDLFGERFESVHNPQRRLVSRPYGAFEMRQLETYADNAITVFFERMESIRNTSIDLGYWVQLFAFDIIGEITFSKRFGFMEAGTDNGVFWKIQTVMKSASWVGHVPWVSTLNNFIEPLLGNKLVLKERNSKFQEFAVEQINARRERGSDHRDLLGQFMEVHKKKPLEFDESSIASVCNSNIVAGSDTTASTIRTIIYYLLHHPECYDKLVSEIKQAWNEGLLSDPVQQAEAERLPYFKAVVQEALRIFPAFGAQLPRDVPEEGITISDIYYPKGTIIGIHPPSLHMNKDVFGEDAEEFNPERWFRPNATEMHHCIMSFSHGNRMCIGKNIAMMEIMKLVSTLLLKYDIELTEPNKEWVHNSHILVFQRGLEVYLRPRVWA